ncbi:Uncharacterised protein [Collinsella intestinalis]|nr:Uncharacterised protein [Collinsella intestinalis]
MAGLMSEALQHTKDPNGAMSMKRLGRFLKATSKVKPGSSIWLLRGVFKWVMQG